MELTKQCLQQHGCTGGTITWSGSLGTGLTKEVGTGTYTATCTNSCGTSGNSNSITISNGAAPSAPSITSNKTDVCSTEKATLTATGCEGGTITWSAGAGVGVSKEVGPGTYTATCTTSCGTSGASNSITIGTKASPVAPSISANKTAVCGTEKATLTASDCADGTITWSGSLGSGLTKEVGAGTYTATCVNSCGTSGNSNSITITSGAVPAAPIISASKTEICGTEEITLTATNCTGTIKWSNDKTGASIKVVAAGDYAAVCENSCGESGNSNIVKIKTASVPNAPLITTDKSSVCDTAKARLVAIGCLTTVEWSNGTTGEFIFVGVGTYTAKCKNTCGTSVSSNIIKIEAGVKPGAPTISTNKTTVCGTDKATLTAIGCEGGTITWSSGGTGATKQVSNGTYTATCTNSCGTSIASNSIVINLGQGPSAPTIVTNKTSVCGTEKGYIDSFWL